MHRRASVLFVLVPAVAIGVGVAFSDASPAPVRCSMARWRDFRLEATRFIGTATTEAVLAGRGPVPEIDPALRIYGLVFRVDKADSVLTERLSDRVRSSGAEVVLVPWGVDAGCRRVSWTDTSQWGAIGVRGLYHGELRPREHWVGDRPTLDIIYQRPYGPTPLTSASSVPSSAGVTTSDTARLTADELLVLYEALPPTREVETGDAAGPAIEPLIRWIREHPHLASRMPAPLMIDQAATWVAMNRLKSIRSPLAGTYQLTLALPTGETFRIFTRTQDRPITMNGWRDDSADTIPGTSFVIPKPTGYALLSHSAGTADGLRPERRQLLQWVQAQGYLSVDIEPMISAPDSTVWQGALDLIASTAATLNTDPALSARLSAMGRSRTAPGTFVLRGDGSVRFEGAVRDGPRTLLRVHGARISLEHLGSPR
jgi:hypothetical protein